MTRPSSVSLRAPRQELDGGHVSAKSRNLKVVCPYATPDCSMRNRDGTCRIPYDVYQRIDIGCKVERDDVRIKVRVVSPIEREIKKIADAMKLRQGIVDKAVPYGKVIAEELPEYSAKVIAAAALSIAARDWGMMLPINELAKVTGLTRDEIREVSRGKAEQPPTDDDQGRM